MCQYFAWSILEPALCSPRIMQLGPFSDMKIRGPAGLECSGSKAMESSRAWGRAIASAAAGPLILCALRTSRETALEAPKTSQMSLLSGPFAKRLAWGMRGGQPEKPSGLGGGCSVSTRDMILLTTPYCRRASASSFLGSRFGFCLVCSCFHPPRSLALNQDCSPSSTCVKVDAPTWLERGRCLKPVKFGVLSSPLHLCTVDSILR